MKYLFAFLPLLAALSATAAEPVVKLAGLQVVFDDGSKEFDGFKTYNSDRGYGITLMVTCDSKEIVGFDDDKAAVKIGGAVAESHFFSPDMSISKDRHTLRLELSAAKGAAPAADGTLKIAGVIPVTLATGKAETRSEPFKVAAGTAVKFPAAKAGLPVLKVKSSGKPKYGGDPFEIVVSTNRKADDFAGIRFYDKDGKPVDSKRGGSSWMSMGSLGSGEITYTFKAPQTELILGVEEWTGREDKMLKVDFNASLAIPK
jgi:hypothetical protein